MALILTFSHDLLYETFSALTNFCTDLKVALSIWSFHHLQRSATVFIFFASMMESLATEVLPLLPLTFTIASGSSVNNGLNQNYKSAFKCWFTVHWCFNPKCVHNYPLQNLIILKKNQSRCGGGGKMHQTTGSRGCIGPNSFWHKQNNFNIFG